MTLFQRWNMTLFQRWNLTLLQRWNMTLFQCWNLTLFQRWNLTLFQRWNLTLFQLWNLTVKQRWKMGCFPDVESNNIVTTLRIGCSTLRPKINLKTTLFAGWDEGLVPEMRIWSILSTKSDLKWCIHLRRSLFFILNCDPRSWFKWELGPYRGHEFTLNWIMIWTFILIWTLNCEPSSRYHFKTRCLNIRLNSDLCNIFTSTKVIIQHWFITRVMFPRGINAHLHIFYSCNCDWWRCQYFTVCSKFNS